MEWEIYKQYLLALNAGIEMDMVGEGYLLLK
jgi:hypothetical protein